MFTRRSAVLLSCLVLAAPARLALGQAVWQTPVRALPGPSGMNGWMATVPFEEDGDPLIVLSVRVNDGAPGWWVLDSGASRCLVDSVVAKGLGLATVPSRGFRGAGMGQVRSDSVVSKVRFALPGGFTTECRWVATADLSGVTGDVGRPVAGLLGYDVFAQYIVQVDYAAHVLRLYDPDTYRHSAAGDTVALIMRHRQPGAVVHIKDGPGRDVRDTLVIDTGSGDAVNDSLTTSSVTSPRYTVRAGGLGQAYSAVVGTLDSVWVGRYAFAGVPSTAPTSGLIGAAIWRRFTCIFDYAHERLYLEPNAAFDAPFGRGPVSGLRFFAPGYRAVPTVSAVEAGSPAAAAGMQVLDELVAVDDQPAALLGLTRITSMFEQRGNAYRLDIRRSGRILRVVLTL